MEDNTASSAKGLVTVSKNWNRINFNKAPENPASLYLLVFSSVSHALLASSHNTLIRSSGADPYVILCTSSAKDFPVLYLEQSCLLEWRHVVYLMYYHSSKSPCPHELRGQHKTLPRHLVWLATFTAVRMADFLSLGERANIRNSKNHLFRVKLNINWRHAESRFQTF